MKSLTGAEIRESYLAWFEAREHTRYPSDSLIPSNDPTLLFTGAGMNQFKDMFLGKGNLPYTRMTTAQKCLRVPDLENVGRTAGHHTFFEMLGNFSFGDYFKAECLPWVFGWFTEGLGLPRDRLVVTIYLDDEEAYKVWTDVVGLAPERIYRFGEKENFWPAEAPSKGPNGPCGPCSEIYFDLEPEQALPSGEGLEELPKCFIEIGNCVFTQFDRQEDGSLPPLPQKNIDVGLGLERITSVLQGKQSNFDTDIFAPYIELVAERSGKRYGEDPSADISMRRIADHARAVTFCISDGALPSNEGRGYVVRKILRRACRDAYELGVEDAILADVCGLVCERMRDAYPQLDDSRKQVVALVGQEEKAFRGIYARGIERFEQWFEALGSRDGWPEREVDELGAMPVPPGSGAVAFELHDTFGFPVDITRALLLDRDLALDEDGFDTEMEAQRERARQGSALSGDVFADNAITRLKERKVPTTEFLGYTELSADSEILALVRDESDVESLQAGEIGELVVARTPSYAESGGQVGDVGEIRGPHGRAKLSDCKRQDGYFFHKVEVLEGRLTLGEGVTIDVDRAARSATERNHTATHILHAALKAIVGEHVGQAGSLVAPGRLRFDFTHGEKLDDETLRKLEDAVSEQIMAAYPLEPQEMAIDEARASGFVAMFGEKYGDTVRTLAIGDYSRELCGGTHVANSGEIGAFRILQETSVAAGVRRIEAVTGYDALHAAQADRGRVDALSQSLKVPASELADRVGKLRQDLRRAEKELAELKRSMAKDASADLEGETRAHGSRQILAASLEGADNAQLLDALDRLRRKHDSFAGVLFGPHDKGVAIVAAVSKDLAGKTLHAGNVLREVAGILGGGGGGRPEMAQGKGKDASKVEAAIERAWELLAAD